MRTMAAPVSAMPDLAAALRCWFAVRHACPSRSKALWALPGERPSTRTAHTVTCWLYAAMAATWAAHPAAGQYTSHSIRAGVASAMSATLLPQPAIRRHGGCAADFAVVHDYIEPTVHDSLAARTFFTWLRPGPMCKKGQDRKGYTPAAPRQSNKSTRRAMTRLA